MKVIEIFGNIFEGAVGNAPTYKNLSTEAAIKFLNTHCKDAIWMLEKDTPLYRGMSKYQQHNMQLIEDFSLVDTMLTTRKSQNTTNYYTVILDNNPLNKDFPKRSKSFVGTTCLDYARGYSSSGTKDVFIMVPTDSAKIGIVNETDMWNTEISLFGITTGIEKFNDMFDSLFNTTDDVTISMFKDFDEKLKNGNKTAINAFHETFGYRHRESNYHLKFLEEIFKAYSSEKTGHEWCYASNFPKNVINSATEVWVSGKIVLIRYDMWQSLVKAFKEKK